MATATKTLWKIDPTHSEVQFKVKHLVISTVTGSFGSYEGKIEAEGDTFEHAKASFVSDIDSISTNNEDRDKHLISDDFFNAEVHLPLMFEFIYVVTTGDQQYIIICDTTNRIVSNK